MRRNPYSRGVPLASQFEDGRLGIISRTEGVQMDWRKSEATASGSFVTRCVVVGMRSGRFFAVGENVVANLGELDLETEEPIFRGPRNEEGNVKRYETIPPLVIGEPWEVATSLARDRSHVGMTHVDWRDSRLLMKHPSIVKFEAPNYFDPARQFLGEHEPEALIKREQTG